MDVVRLLGVERRVDRLRQLTTTTQVAAESLSRLFTRNAVAVGLPVLVCTGVHAAFADGDGIEIDLSSGLVLNLESGSDLQGDSLPKEMREILEAGGILAVPRNQGVA